MNNNNILLGVGAIVLVILFVGGLLIWQGSQTNNADMQTNTTSSTAMAANQQNIVEIAQANPDLKTLVTAVVAADLGETLASSDANFTVFAPTDSAFAQISDTVDQLLQPASQAQLAAVLGYHVIPNEVFVADIMDGMQVTTLNGESIKLRVIAGEVYVNDSKVIVADVEASNGVVHVIDQVMVPGEFGSVVDTAVANPDLQTLVAAVTAADLVDVLSDPSAEYTVFAPTDAAFGEIGDTVEELLLPANQADLANVLQYHVVGAEAFSAELTDGQVIETLNGESLTVEITDAGVFIVAANSRAQVVAADVKTSNGVVHVIDNVLLP